MKKPLTGKKPRFSKSSERTERRPARRDSGRFDDKPHGRRPNSRSDGERVLYDMVCAECGKSDKVPFKPSTSKPLLCGRCFGKSGDSSSRGGYDSKPRGRRDFDGHDSKPRGRRDFGGHDSKSHGRRDFPRADDSSKQMKEINQKLDKILALLEDTIEIE